MANSEMGMESIDSGSNYKFGDKLIKPNAPKSLFDLSFLSSMDMYNGGLMYPLCEPIECIMGDDVEISVASLLRVLPQEVPLYSRQRLYVYAFYSRMGDLWNHWNTFAKKGMLGKTIKEIPTLQHEVNFDDGQYGHSAQADQRVVTGSLFDYLGLPIGMNPVNGSYYKKINALPMMMYTRIWRDYFANKNAVAGNPVIFPDDDDEFRLDDDGRLISAKAQDYTDEEEVEHKFNLIWGSSKTAAANTTEANREALFGVSCEVDDTKGNIRMGLFYHNWPDDRFTDALPWPQRGDTPTLEIDFTAPTKLFNTKDDDYPARTIANLQSYWNERRTVEEENLYLRELSGYMGGDDPDYKGNAGMVIYRGGNQSIDFDESASESNSHILKPTVLTPNQILGIDADHIGNYLNSIYNSSTWSASAEITLNKIRELAIEQTELEKMARTDGTYMGFGLTFFGEKPKNGIDYKPIFIGGTYTDLNFTEVLQTGGATEASPLGTYAGHGIAGNSLQQGYIGKVHCDDYGYIMILGCIMPDVYYSQKLDKMWTRKFQSDIYLPERAKMGMVPILNHEVDALHSPAGKTPFDLWAYNNPFDELRYRPNEIHGQIADSTKASFWAYTQARNFDAAPLWGKAFSEAKDVRMDYLAAGTTESAYTAQFKFNIRAVRALPYKPVPASII